MPEDLSQDALRLLHQRNSGALATHSIVTPGFPFVSAAPYALIENGNCVFLFSSLSTHSKNLRAHDQASLLVTGGSEGDLSDARLTLQGHVRPIAESQSNEAKTWAGSNLISGKRRCIAWWWTRSRVLRRFSWHLIQGLVTSSTTKKTTTSAASTPTVFWIVEPVPRLVNRT